MSQKNKQTNLFAWVKKKPIKEKNTDDSTSGRVNEAFESTTMDIDTNQKSTSGRVNEAFESTTMDIDTYQKSTSDRVNEAFESTTMDIIIHTNQKSDFIDENCHKPYQPRNIQFPTTKVGNQSRSFKSTWFDEFPWLHYCTSKDSALCFTCSKAYATNKKFTQNSDMTFITDGFRNWKNAKSTGKGFLKHEASQCHRDAVLMYVVAPSDAYGDVVKMQSKAHSEDIALNQKMLMKLLTSIQFLARQALPLRGKWSSESHCEENSNFYQLLVLRSKDEPLLESWLKRKRGKYTSPDIQNEILQEMSMELLTQIVKEVQKAKFFTVMADETADVSNKEQLVLCIRWVNDDLVAHEEFIGLYTLARTQANNVVEAIKNALDSIGLDIQNARGQCYDGAATMSGVKTGVATQFKELNSKMLFTHCYGHALNLAVKDSCTKIISLREAFETTREICKLVKKSPQRDTKLKDLRDSSENSSKTVHDFCPTRWTVRGETLASVINNFHELMDLWEWSLDIVKDTEMKARIIGVKSIMPKFSFLFSCVLGEEILKKTDNLSKILQGTEISAAEGQNLAEITIASLESRRNDESFDLFWKKLLDRKNDLSAEDPVLPRKRKVPQRFHEGAEYVFPAESKDLFRKIYYEVYDFVKAAIGDRFNQKDYQMYKRMENLIINSIKEENFEEEIDEVGKFYTDDLQKYQLKAQLQMLPFIVRDSKLDITSFSLSKFIALVKTFNKPKKKLISEVITLLKLIIVAPATNAVSERSFSSLKRLKTYMRSTTSDARLNSLMLLHVHKDKTSKIDLKEVAKHFISKQPCRRNIFGKM